MEKAVRFVNQLEVKSVCCDRSYARLSGASLLAPGRAFDQSSGLTVATSAALILIVLPDTSSNS